MEAQVLLERLVCLVLMEPQVDQGPRELQVPPVDQDLLVTWDRQDQLV